MMGYMEGVSISYLGVSICGDAEILESDAARLRVTTREPMPVGTELEVTIEGTARRARVTAVAEVREAAGMTLAFVEEQEAKPKRRRRKTAS